MALESVPATPSPGGLPRDARMRLMTSMVLAFGFAAVQDWRLVPPMLAVAAVAVSLSGCPAALLWHWLRLPGGVVLAVLALLPFVVGHHALFRIGPLTVWAEGTAAAALVAGRFLAIVSVAAAMLGPLPPWALVQALRALGVPAAMADLALLVLRYLDEVRGAFARMRLAAALRGRPLHGRRLRDIGWLMTAMLLRAHDRAERQWQAMRVRGYGQARAAAAWPGPSAADRLVLAGSLLAMALLAGADLVAPVLLGSGV